MKDKLSFLSFITSFLATYFSIASNYLSSTNKYLKSLIVFKTLQTIISKGVTYVYDIIGITSLKIIKDIIISWSLMTSLIVAVYFLYRYKSKILKIILETGKVKALYNKIASIVKEYLNGLNKDKKPKPNEPENHLHNTDDEQDVQ